MKETPKNKVPIATTTTVKTKTKVEFDSQLIVDNRLDKIDQSDKIDSSDTSAAPPPASFVIKCLLRTARFMWQVTTIPSKIGDTIGTLYRYAQDSVDSFLCVAG